MQFPDITDKPFDEIMMIKSSLPETALNISRIIGLPATVRLISEFGGTEIRIPGAGSKKTSIPYQELVDAIGDDALIGLINAYAGDEIYIPICTKTRLILRNMGIIRDYNALIANLSSRQAVRKLATQYFLSSRQVENIVNRPLASQA